LYFGYNFDQEIKDFIPNSVKYIITNNKDYYQKLKKGLANLNIIYHVGAISYVKWY
jgi:hypothetical protein